ncbi:MAG: Ig-like domain-containing protein, partial [Verrucomicrobia bacterium]|nr:Ig-like domain-containing protein [Verrucomicrobiota bacterium]
NGVITWTPGEAQGPSTNTITTVVSDGALSATNSFEVVVTEVNEAPVATNDIYAVSNSTLTVVAPGVLANDSDSDLPTNTLTAVLVSGPANGTLTLSSNGGFVYTPNLNFTGLDTFTYRASDGLTNSEITTVSMTVSNRPFIITSVTLNSGIATVTWNSQTGLTYRVQYKDSLAAANWSDATPEVTATNISTSLTNFVGNNPQRFYRVQIVEPTPTILSLQLVDGAAIITWSSVTPRDYRLQYKTNLTDLSWVEVLPSITAIGPTTATTNVVGSASQRFFRVRLMP